MQVNSNTVNLADYRGTIKPCPLCYARTPAAKLEAAMTGKACRMCMGHEFVAKCKNCGGTGQYTGRTVWDGGRSEHKSTCTPCGGTGVFPVRKPKDWKDPDPEPAQEEKSAAPPPPPAPPVPQSITLPPPVTMNSGTVLPGGVVVK